jgi:hypothetical protein
LSETKEADRQLLTMMRLFTLLFALLVSTTGGFTLKGPPQRCSSPVNHVEEIKMIAAVTGPVKHASKSWPTNVAAAATAALLSSNLLPLVSFAAEATDEYEYGSVNAPIGLAVGAGIVAILTAAVPVLLRPGEKALDEMREREGNAFGTGKTKDTLNKRRK